MKLHVYACAVTPYGILNIKNALGKFVHHWQSC